jgi:hypothetical protein
VYLLQTHNYRVNQFMDKKTGHLFGDPFVYSDIIAQRQGVAGVTVEMSMNGIAPPTTEGRMPFHLVSAR